MQKIWFEQQVYPSELVHLIARPLVVNCNQKSLSIQVKKQKVLKKPNLIQCYISETFLIFDSEKKIKQTNLEYWLKVESLVLL